jgi:hypothetical protein
MAQREELFSRGSLRDTLESASERVAEDVDQLPEDHLLHADVEELVAALIERRGMRTPKLGEPWMDEPQEVSVDVSGDFNRFIRDPRYARIAGYRVVVHIPFNGDGAIFLLRPSTYTNTAPIARVEMREIHHVIEYPHDRQIDIKASTDQLIREINEYLKWSGTDISQYNVNIGSKARAAIQSRRERIKRHHEHLATTGLPMRSPGSSSKTYIPDVIVRRPAPSLPTNTGSTPIALEPVLGDEVFAHILGVIRSVGLDMERSPKTYAAMGEEDLRQVLLAALNPSYRGQTTAEAFNFQGKTDLLIRHEGSNLFIAECKFWNGPKGFFETIDQLFGYAAWRDTKLAVIMFVREKGLTSVIEKAKEALLKHAQFVDLAQAASETELRAKMSWPGDERRHADLNIFFIQIPTETS